MATRRYERRLFYHHVRLLCSVVLPGILSDIFLQYIISGRRVARGFKIWHGKAYLGQRLHIIAAGAWWRPLRAIRWRMASRTCALDALPARYAHNHDGTAPV